MEFFSVISTKVDKLCPNSVLYTIKCYVLRLLVTDDVCLSLRLCSTYYEFFSHLKKPNESGKSQMKKVNLWAAESKQWRDVKTLQAGKTSFS